MKRYTFPITDILSGIGGSGVGNMFSLTNMIGVTVPQIHTAKGLFHTLYDSHTGQFVRYRSHPVWEPSGVLNKLLAVSHKEHPV